MWNQFKIFKLGSVVDFIKQNSKFVILCLLMIVGILLGSLSLGSIGTDHTEQLVKSFENFYSMRSQLGFFPVVLRSVFVSSLCLLVVYFCGLFLFGAPLTVLYSFVRGLGIGLACSYIYANYGLKGTAFSLLILMIPLYLYSIILILACQDAFDFSRSMFWYYGKSRTVPLPTAQLFQYHKRFFLYLLLTILISFIDGLLTFVFIHIFAF